MPVQWCRLLVCAACLLVLSCPAPAAPPQPLEYLDNGAFRLAGLRCQVIHYGPGWEMSGVSDAMHMNAGFPKRNAGGQKVEVEVRGQWSVRPSGTFAFHQMIKPVPASPPAPTGSGAFAFQADVSAAAPVPTNALCLSITLPLDGYAGESLTIDGKAVPLPRQAGDPTVFAKAQARKLLIPAESGQITIDGPADILVQDDRRWNGQHFTIRLSLNPAKGDVSAAALKLTLNVPPQIKPLQKPVTILAGDQWRPYEHELDVQPGSILDFSNLLDAPAGKYGRVVVRDGHFVFENRPDRPVRFYGANLCFSANYPSHDQADKLADRLARMGYNAVRMHHYDAMLTDPAAADSVTLQKDQLDRIEYFVSALKKRGIYLTIDLYTIRQPRDGEIPEIAHPIRDGYKALVPILDSAMSNWQAFARNLLTHRNPYTDLTWAEDPVLIGICPLNEDPLSLNYHASPEVARLYDQRFADWLKRQNLAPASATARDAALCQFLSQTQIDANRRMAAFLRGLGVRALLTGVNCVDAMSLVPVRAEFDYVDNHAYWDHPGFPEKAWSLPESYRNSSDISAGADVPRRMFPTRIIGKPFTVTEFNYCMPNRYRAEGGPLIGAYAALQDWDGLWRFAWSHDLSNTQKVIPAIGFDIGTDPISILSDRIAVLQFLRGDVAPGKRMIPVVVTPQMAYTRPANWGTGGFDQQVEYAGLYTQVGSQWQAAPAAGAASASSSATTLPAGAVDIPSRHVLSDTGQIELAGKDGAFRVLTPRSESFTRLSAGELSGAVARVQTDGTATIAVAAMDGKELPVSSRILIFHLTDVQNTGIRYGGESLTLLEKWGQLPHLVRAGKATLRLTLTGPGSVKVYRLDAAGRRGQAVPVQQDGPAWVIPLDTTAGPAPALAYELVR